MRCNRLQLGKTMWLRKMNTRLSKLSQNQKVIIKPAIKRSLDGRPKNGMLIVIPISWNLLSIKYMSPNSSRIQSVLLTIGKCKLLLIDTYFPTDP